MPKTLKPKRGWAVASAKHGLMNRVDVRKYALEGLCFSVGGELVTDGKMIPVKITPLDAAGRRLETLRDNLVKATLSAFTKTKYKRPKGMTGAQWLRDAAAKLDIEMARGKGNRR